MTPARVQIEQQAAAIRSGKKGKPSTNGEHPVATVTNSPRRFVPDVTLMSDVKVKAVKWHWPGRVPAGMTTILFGPPGVSKSIVVAYLTATTTTGGYWPGGTHYSPKGSVLMLACEDEPETTIGPRLMAAGADLTKVKLLGGKRPEGESGANGFALAISLQDIELIEEAMDDDCKLLIIDPAGSYMGPGIDNHKDNEVRAVLMPLALLARKRGIAVVLVCHSNKTMANQLAMDAIIGSRGFSGVVRSVLACVSDPDAEDYPKRKLLLHAKCNVAQEADGLAYKLDSATDVIGNPPRIVWEDEPLSGVGADDYLGARSANRSGGGDTGRPASAREEAIRLIERVLVDGPVSVNQIKSVAQAAGMSWATMDRARAELGVTGKPQKGKFEIGKRPLYFWYFGDDWEPPAETTPALDTGTFDADGESEGQKAVNGADFPREHQPRKSSEVDGGYLPSTSKVPGSDADGQEAAQISREHQKGIDVDAHGENQAETPDSGGSKARQHQKSRDLRDGTPKTPRKKSAKPTPPSDDPLTDSTAFTTLLNRSGWGWPEVRGWLDGKGEYVPGVGGYEALTGPQKVMLIDHLTGIVKTKGGAR